MIKHSLLQTFREMYFLLQGITANAKESCSSPRHAYYIAFRLEKYEKKTSEMERTYELMSQ